jgi:hypothetical protein
MTFGADPITSIQIGLNPHGKRYPRATSGQTVFRVGLVGGLVGAVIYLYASGRRGSAPSGRGQYR